MYYTETIDWISSTWIKSHPVYPASWPIESVETSGANNYSMGQRFTDGRWQLENPSRPDMGIHVIISGSTIAELMAIGASQKDIVNFASQGRISRFDVAIDLYDHHIDLNALKTAFQKGYCRTRATTARDTSHWKKGQGSGCYIGYYGSNHMVIYDKAAELGLKDTTRWRIEVRYKKQKARAAAEAYLNGANVRSLIKSFAHFYKIDWWCSIFDTEPMPLQVERKDSDTWKWLLKSCAPSLAREIALDRNKLHLFIQHVLDISNQENGEQSDDD